MYIVEKDNKILINLDKAWNFRDKVQSLKELGARYNPSTKEWLLSNEHKAEILQAMNWTFTTTEDEDADKWFQQWWNDLDFPL